MKQRITKNIMRRNVWAVSALVAGAACIAGVPAAHAQSVNVGAQAQIRVDAGAVKQDMQDRRADMRDDTRQMRMDMSHMRDDVRGALSDRFEGTGIIGTVATKDGTTLTVDGKIFANFGPNATATASTTFTVDASNATVRTNADGRPATSTIDSISIGDRVIVRGDVNDTAVTAKEIDLGSFMDHGRWASSTPHQVEKKSGFFGKIAGFFRGLFGIRAGAKADVNTQ